MLSENASLAKKMIEYRARENISAKELARRCRISTQTVYYLENELQSPTKVTRQKILDVIDKK